MKRRISSAIPAILVGLLLGTSGLHAQSIAQNYPGDVNIENDPNVVFVERFDEASLSALYSRWTDTKGTMSFVADSPPGSPLTNSLHIDGPSGGGHLFRSFSPGIDTVAYLRTYVKYPSGGFYHHSGGQMGGYNPITPWPQGGAGLLPSGSASFTVNCEPLNASTTHGFYVYWMGMYPDGLGNYWGNLFAPQPALLRDQWVCVEVMVKLNNPVSSTNGELAYWINGTQIQHFGPGFPNVTRSGGIWTIDPAGWPFPGFQWRNDTALNINWIWLENYVANVSPQGSLRFAHVVLARSYIGPIGGGPPAPAPAPTPGPSPGSSPVSGPGSATGGGSGHESHNLAHRCGCSSIAEEGIGVGVLALAALFVFFSRRS